MPSLHFIKQALLMVLLISLACSDKPPREESQTSNPQVATADPNDWQSNKGIGPISTVSFSEDIDETLAEEGKNIFVAKCSACHKPDKKYIGPAMAGIYDRRTPEWTMNMILNPDGMVKDDPIAKELLMEYNGTPMANQNLTEEEARAIVEYFRTLKSE